MTLWIGESLGPVERACLRSVMRQGHTLALYCYRRPGGVPDGVEVRNAADILPEHKMIWHRKGGSVAVFADWFRYRLQKLALGTWLDTDNYLIGPVDMDETHLFGEYEVGKIANGVVRLPPDSPMLDALLNVFENGRTPSWLPWHAYYPARLRELVARRGDLARLPWGTTGPFAITALARQFGLSSLAVPSEVFNPVPWRRADWICDPSVELDQLVTSRMVGIHLWNQCIKSFKNAPAPSGSFLARLHDEGRD